MRTITTYLIATLLTVGFTASAWAAKSKEELTQKTEEARQNFFKADEGLKKIFDDSAGYVIFPSVAKGGLMYEASVGGQKFKYEAY